MLDGFLKKYPLFVLLLVVFFTRGISLFYYNWELDGDEAVIGLMAKHFLDGKCFQLFFYGQKYGLALIEYVITSLFFAIFGIKSVVMKIGMVLFWSSGLVFLYFALQKWYGKFAASFSVTFLVFSPAWFSWSMKARGGYVTGFVFASCFLWLLAESEKHNILKSFATGFIAISLFYCQPVWFIGFFPFIVFGLYIIKRKRNRIGYLLGLTAGIVIFQMYVFCISQKSWSPHLFQKLDITTNFIQLPTRLWISLSGAFHYYDVVPRMYFSKTTGFLCLSIFTFLFLSLIIKALRGKLSKSFASLLGVVGIIIFSLLIAPKWFAFRYFLPIPVLLTSSLAAFLSEQKIKNFYLVIFLVPGILAVPDFPHVYERNKIEDLVTTFLKEDIQCVYSMDPLLQWQILFYSQEKIFARWLEKNDRCPEYPEKVDAVFYKTPQQTALVGWKYQMSSLCLKDPKAICLTGSEQYFILKSPSLELLLNLGYKTVSNGRS